MSVTSGSVSVSERLGDVAGSDAVGLTVGVACGEARAKVALQHLDVVDEEDVVGVAPHSLRCSQQVVPALRSSRTRTRTLQPQKASAPVERWP